jgi:hypothetical protein
MKDAYAFSVSVLALAISAFTLWLTQWRRGNLRMTTPVLVGFLYDLPAGELKVFFRSMLFSTGKRGHIIESLFLRVRCGESSQVFNFWMYGETKALMIGSGLRVTEDGVTANHHFMPPKGENNFAFLAGEYAIEVYARIIMRSATVLLSSVKVTLTEPQATALKDKRNGFLFTWGPDSQSYRAQIDTAPASMGASV